MLLLLDEDEGNCVGTDDGGCIRLQLSVVELDIIMVGGGGGVLVAATLVLEFEVRWVSLLLFETALLTSDIFGAISPSHNPHNDINLLADISSCVAYIGSIIWIYVTVVVRDEIHRVNTPTTARPMVIGPSLSCDRAMCAI